MGFEPTRGNPNGLAVHRLNHSATSSRLLFACFSYRDEVGQSKRARWAGLWLFLYPVPPRHSQKTTQPWTWRNEKVDRMWRKRGLHCSQLMAVRGCECVCIRLYDDRPSSAQLRVCISTVRECLTVFWQRPCHFWRYDRGKMDVCHVSRIMRIIPTDFLRTGSCEDHWDRVWPRADISCLGFGENLIKCLIGSLSDLAHQKCINDCIS